MRNDAIHTGSTRFDLKIWAKLLPFFRDQKRRLILIGLMLLLPAITDALMPLFIRYAVNSFIVPGQYAGLGRFSLVYLAVILFQGLSVVIYSRQSMMVEMYSGRAMKHACFMHLQKLPLAYYNVNSVGYILARVMSDTDHICGLVAWGFNSFVWNILYLLAATACMYALDVRMALIVTAVLPAVLILTIIFQPKILRARRRVRHANAMISGSFNENINGAKTAKTLVIEDRLCREFRSITDEMYTQSVKASRLGAIYVPLISCACAMTVAFILKSSGTMVMDGSLDYGVLSAFIAYAVSILDPVSEIASIFTQFLDVQVSIERVDALLHEKITIADSPEIEEAYGTVFDPKPERCPPIRGAVSFDHVWFRYPDAPDNDYVLEDICLDIPAGTTVAIVGETGAGKSTLVNLACRFFEPTKGCVRIDGVDYRTRSQNWLHSNLGYVQQSPHLFSGTIRENIRYGRLDATDQEVEAAAKLVFADTVAAKMKLGYDAPVGEGGDLLSTGEKQLVSFARAVLANPPIFILDEATSSIDTETELLIQNAISKILEGRTSFIIAHRLSTIRSADLILVVENRRILERGSHAELMAAKGRYYNLYTSMMIQEE